MADPVPNAPQSSKSGKPGSIWANHKVGLAGLAGVLGTGIVALVASNAVNGPATQEAQSTNGPAAAEGSVFKPAQAGQPASRSVPAQARGGFADFIVKLEDAPEVAEAIRLFRKDKAAGRAAFEAWQAENPDFADFEFRGGSYSGEAFLRKRFDGPPDRSRVAAALERLRASPDVAYCDPDYTAHPGQGD